MKLIVDKDTLHQMASKVKGSPIFAGPNGDLLAPGIVDLLGEGNSGRWQPGDERTKQMVLSGEACRDVLFYVDSFLDPSTRRHSINRLAVPLWTLMCVVSNLVRNFNDEKSRHIRESSWPHQDRDSYASAVRRLKKVKEHGPIRAVRNKLAAHLDPNVFVEKTPILKPDDILKPLGDCALLLLLSLNYPSHWFSWIRSLGRQNEESYIVETMFSYPLCVRWITDPDGHVKSMDSMFLAADPRAEIRDRIIETITAFNKMIEAVNSNLPPLYIVPTDELRKGNDDANSEQKNVILQEGATD